MMSHSTIVVSSCVYSLILKLFYIEIHKYFQDVIVLLRLFMSVLFI